MKAANINLSDVLTTHHQRIYRIVRFFRYICGAEEKSIGGAKNLKFDPSFTSAALSRAYETITRTLIILPLYIGLWVMRMSCTIRTGCYKIG